MVPQAPDPKFSQAWHVSSVSMGCLKMFVRARTETTGPMNHWSRSSSWMLWLASEPPPS